MVAALEDGGLEVITRPGLQRLRGVRGTQGLRISAMDMDTRLIVTGQAVLMIMMLQCCHPNTILPTAISRLEVENSSHCRSDWVRILDFGFLA